MEIFFLVSFIPAGKCWYGCYYKYEIQASNAVGVNMWQD